MVNREVLALRILFVSAAVGGRGGIERVTTLVTDELESRGHHVRVLLFGPSRHPRWEEHLVDRHVGPQNLHRHLLCRWLDIVRWSRHRIREFGPDVVIGMTPSALVVSRMVRTITRLSYPIWSWLHEALSQLDHPWAIGYADAHLAISSGVGNDIAKRIGRTENIHVVYNPIVNAHLQSRPALHEQVHFVYIGRLDNSVKRIEDIFRSLALVRQPWLLSIVGDGEDGQLLRNLAEDLNIASRVRWLGWSSEPWDVVGPVSALVLASISEGFGVVLAEALVRGVPIIASACAHGPRDIVQPNLNGWLFPPRNISALHEILLRIVNNPQELPEAITVAATGARFHLANVVDRMLEALGTSFSGRDI